MSSFLNINLKYKMLPPRSLLKTRVRPGLAKSRSRAVEEEDERYNPIRPSNGNIVMRGGAYDIMNSSRTPRLSMADSRAMEIQRRNETPGTGATPVMGVSQFRGGAMERYVGGAMERCVGGSAVPSMGLSEFRGGDNDLLEYTNVKRSGAYEGQGRGRKSMPPVTMRGGKHQRNGHALSEHLLAELGAPSHKKLLEGMMKHGAGIHGGGFFDFLDPNKNGVANAFRDFGAKVKNEFVNPQSVLRTKVANEFTNPESVLRGKVLPYAARVGQFIAPALNVAVPGAGTAISTGLSAAQGANQQAKAFGFGRRGKKGQHMMPDGSMMDDADMKGGKRGCGKKKRAPASAGDGRRKRADIVRKVMAERGVKMIEASKIVKAEGLY